MSVLICGMEMPTSCFLCPLSVLNGERLFCEITKDEVIRAKRSSDCPLVPVPPHGRLIDADELKTAFPCGESVRTECVRATIDYAPTIIPAEDWKSVTQTNADRIRQMTDEELAEWIYQVQDGDAYQKENYLPPLSTAWWLKWLKKEAR